MPRLSRSFRQMVRLSIIEAAVHCFARNGLERTPIAGIAAEAKSSAGSIYTHYRGKADLIRAVAHAVVDERAAAVGLQRASKVTAAPEDIVAELTATIHPQTARVAVQLWGAATTDPVIRGILAGAHAEMRRLLQDCVVAWLAEAGKVAWLAEAGKVAWLAEAGKQDPSAELAADMTERLLERYRNEQLNAALHLDPDEHPAWKHVWLRSPVTYGTPDSMSRWVWMPRDDDEE